MAHDIEPICADNIFSSDNFRVDYFAAANPSGALLFTFTQFSNRQLNGFGFAGHFAVNNGFDLISIKSNIDDWYKTFPLNAFDRIDDYLSRQSVRHCHRATYGSSMGGYAAIRFARNVNANIVFAISPQFDIAQSWDRRWGAAAKATGLLHTMSDADICDTCKYVLAYDPFDLDRLHVEKFAEIIPHYSLERIELPYAGHPVVFMLRDFGVLSKISLSVLLGGGEKAFRLTRDIRKDGREKSGLYHYNMALHCLKRKKMKWSERAIGRALKISPLDPQFRLLAAKIAETNNDLDEAILNAALAMSLAPKLPYMVVVLSRLLDRKGLRKLALHHIDNALALDATCDLLVKHRAALIGAAAPARAWL